MSRASQAPVEDLQEELQVRTKFAFVNHALQARLEALELKVLSLQDELKVLNRLSTCMVKAHMAFRESHADLVVDTLRKLGFLPRRQSHTFLRVLEDMDLSDLIASGMDAEASGHFRAASSSCVASTIGSSLKILRRSWTAGSATLPGPASEQLSTEERRGGASLPHTTPHSRSRLFGAAHLLPDTVDKRISAKPPAARAAAPLLGSLETRDRTARSKPSQDVAADAGSLQSLLAEEDMSRAARLQDGHRGGTAVQPPPLLRCDEQVEDSGPLRGQSSCFSGPSGAFLQAALQYSSLADPLTSAMGAASALPFSLVSRAGRECMNMVSEKLPGQSKEALKNEQAANGILALLEEVWQFVTLADTFASNMGAAMMRQFGMASRACRECMRGARCMSVNLTGNGLNPANCLTAPFCLEMSGSIPGQGQGGAKQDAVLGQASAMCRGSSSLGLPSSGAILPAAATTDLRSGGRRSQVESPVPPEPCPHITVRLHGLSSRPDLNGLLGRLVHCSYGWDRCFVVLPTGQGIRVRGLNLQVVKKFDPLPRIVDDLSQRSRRHAGVSASASHPLQEGAVCIFGGRQKSLDSDTVHLFVPGCDLWHRLPSLPTPRAHACLASLGECLYVAGGRAGSAALSSGELFDASLGQWRALPCMSQARYLAAAAVLGGGVYLCGGFRRRGSALASCERLGPGERAWTALPWMLQARGSAAALVVAGSLYVSGGCGSDDAAQGTVERFTPSAGVWTGIFSLPWACLTAAEVAHGNYLYICGGSNGDISLSCAARFDHSTGKWESLPSMRTARRGAAAAAAPSGDVVVCGGAAGNAKLGHAYQLSSVECFRSCLGCWEELPKMSVPRSCPATAVLGGRLYVLGGRDRQLATTQAECLDLRHETWRPLPRAPEQLLMDGAVTAFRLQG